MKLRTLLATLVSLSGLALFAHAAPLAVGSPAPEISGVDQEGKTVNFKSVYEKGPTLVYFFPKADTPGCTKQGCSIRDAWADLTKAGIQVIGVSEDTVEAQKAFADKFHFPHTLIANKPLTQRESFLVRDGKVAWTMLKGTSTDTHAADVLKANAELSKK